MQRTIVHVCGHAKDHYIIGEFAADYDRQAAKIARQLCNSCRTQARGADARQGVRTDPDAGHVALQGSPKQISWAETIRAKRLPALQRHDSAAALAVARVTDAKWWIDRRADPDAMIVAAATAFAATL